MLGVNSYPNSNQITVQDKTNTQSVTPSFRRYDGYNSFTPSSSSKTKKLAVGFASFAIPGLGQVINGETSKGVAFFLGAVCNGLLFFRKRNNMLLGTIGRLGIGGWAAHDAYKKA